jgi:hypothetical protein
MGFAERHPNIERSQVSDVSVGFSRSSVRQPILPSIFDHPRRFTRSHVNHHYHPTAAKARTGLYRSSLIMIAHAIRASLLAYATVATFIGRRLRRRSIQGVVCAADRFLHPTIARAP